MTKLVYFAWVRERMGRPEELLDIPDGVGTVADLIEFLANRDEEGAAAFADRKAIRAAIDHEHVPSHSPLGDAREIAFFPPMTGG